MKRMIPGMTIAVLVAIVTAACGGPAPTASPTPQPTAVLPTQAQPTAATQATVPQIQQQVAAGMKVYGASCSRCHGAKLVDGSAPRLEASALAKYGTAQKLFDKVSRTMPQSNPGALSGQEYYDVLSYLLFQQGFLKPDQVVNAQTLGSIMLSP